MNALSGTIIVNQLLNYPVNSSGRHEVPRLRRSEASRQQERDKSQLDLALRGNDKDFTAIDRVKSETAAQTKTTGRRTVLKLFHYITHLFFPWLAPII
jgi:hypothetical protein